MCFENVFKRKPRKTNHAFNQFLRDVSLLTLSQRKNVCDEEISEQEVIFAMKSFSNNKSPKNNLQTKEFNERFWEELKQSFMNLLSHAKVNKELVSSKR